MARLKTDPDWKRAELQAPVGDVDDENNIIRGAYIAQAGPFKSAGRGEFDNDAIDELLRLGRKAPNGLKARFTHPTLSSDGLGRFVGRWKNLRIVERGPRESFGNLKTDRVKALVGDLHIDPTAMEPPPDGGGTPIGVYIMRLAQSDPDAFSTSLVLTVDKEYRMDKNGHRATDDNGNELPPLWRPTAVHAADIVDTGDASDGFLSVDALPDAVVRRGTELLDRQFAEQPREVVESRCQAYLSRYLDARYGVEAPQPKSREWTVRELGERKQRWRERQQFLDSLHKKPTNVPEIHRHLTLEQGRERVRRYREALRDLRTLATVDGIAVPWLQADARLDGSLERTARGCGTHIHAPSIWLNLNHEGAILGTVGDGTVRLRYEDDGIWARVRIPDTPLGRRALSMLRAGDITGFSAEMPYANAPGEAVMCYVGDPFSPYYGRQVLEYRHLPMLGVALATTPLHPPSRGKFCWWEGARRPKHPHTVPSTQTPAPLRAFPWRRAAKSRRAQTPGARRAEHSGAPPVSIAAALGMVW